VKGDCGREGGVGERGVRDKTLRIFILFSSTFNEWPLAIVRELSRRTQSTKFMGITAGKKSVYQKVIQHESPSIRRVLSEIVQETGLKEFLLNKLQPKNQLDQFSWMKELDLPFTVNSVKRLDNRALVQSSRHVVGITSMFLREASALGTPTLNIIPRKIEDRFPGGAHSRLIARTPSELRVTVENPLENGLFNSARIQDGQEVMNHRGATLRVVGKLYEVLEIFDGIYPDH